MSYSGCFRIPNIYLEIKQVQTLFYLYLDLVARNINLFELHIQMHIKIYIQIDIIDWSQRDLCCSEIHYKNYSSYNTIQNNKIK